MIHPGPPKTHVSLKGKEGYFELIGLCSKNEKQFTASVPSPSTLVNKNNAPALLNTPLRQKLSGRIEASECKASSIVELYKQALKRANVNSPHEETPSVKLKTTLVAPRKRRRLFPLKTRPYLAPRKKSEVVNNGTTSSKKYHESPGIQARSSAVLRTPDRWWKSLPSSPEIIRKRGALTPDALDFMSLSKSTRKDHKETKDEKKKVIENVLKMIDKNRNENEELRKRQEIIFKRSHKVLRENAKFSLLTGKKEVEVLHKESVKETHEKSTIASETAKASNKEHPQKSDDKAGTKLSPLFIEE